jgi:hypothetical protein
VNVTTVPFSVLIFISQLYSHDSRSDMYLFMFLTA